MGMDTPTRHQVRIARDTLRLSDVGALILGGMTKAFARTVLTDKAGWSSYRVAEYESDGDTLRRCVAMYKRRGFDLISVSPGDYVLLHNARTDWSVRLGINDSSVLEYKGQMEDPPLRHVA